MFDMKNKYDESDHVVLRATKSVTEKVSDIFGSYHLPLLSVFLNSFYRI